ncbi:hypothetical protein Bca101_017426 [Brassica carinata]
MDREWGSKPVSWPQIEAIDLRDYECKLCQTLHNKEGNYMAHTQGMRHQPNLAKRAARETLDAPTQPQPQPHKRKVSVRRTVSALKLRLVDQGNGSSTTPELMTRPLLFQNEYPEIEDNIKPKHRVMSSFEQKVQPYDNNYQYILFAAELYEIKPFKVPSIEIG